MIEKGPGGVVVKAKCWKSTWPESTLTYGTSAFSLIYSQTGRKELRRIRKERLQLKPSCSSGYGKSLVASVDGIDSCLLRHKLASAF